MGNAALRRAERLAHRGDDQALCLLAEIGVHRKADHTLGEPFGLRNARRRHRKLSIRSETIERARIVDRGWDAGLAAGFGKLVAPLGDYGVLRPDRGCAADQLRHFGDRTKRIVVALGPDLPRRNLIGKQAELFDQDRGLDRVEPAVEPHMLGVGPAWTLAVIAQRKEPRRLVVVVGEDRAAIAVTAERLGRIEAGRGIRRERADFPPVEARAETLGGVRDHEKFVLFGDRADGFVIGRLSVEIDRDHATRGESKPLRLAYCGLETFRIEVETFGTHIDKDWLGAAKQRHLGGGNEGECRHEDRIAGAYAFGHQSKQQGVGAVRATDAMARAAEGGKLPLELGDLGPENVLTVLEHRRDHPLDAVAQPLALRGEVDEGGNGLRAVLTHAIYSAASLGILSVERLCRGLEVWARQASNLVDFQGFPSTLPAGRAADYHSRTEVSNAATGLHRPELLKQAGRRAWMPQRYLARRMSPFQPRRA